MDQCRRQVRRRSPTAGTDSRVLDRRHRHPRRVVYIHLRYEAKGSLGRHCRCNLTAESAAMGSNGWATQTYGRFGHDSPLVVHTADRAAHRSRGGSVAAVAVRRRGQSAGGTCDGAAVGVDSHRAGNSAVPAVPRDGAETGVPCGGAETGGSR